MIDPFAGSGSTGVAAAAEEMRFWGCELDPEYIEVAEARCRHAYGEYENPAVRGVRMHFEWCAYMRRDADEE